MNYRHIYHAGNFGDVFKHLLLIALIQSLQKKDKPICYLDTHAGIGNYDLQHPNAKKTQEFRGGVEKLLRANLTQIPLLIRDYLTIIENWNHEQGADNGRYYPGSPTFVRKLLRPMDRMILTELHPEDRRQLKQRFLQDKQVAVHHLDGYQALKAFLPPKENRGLVLIDPPFEKTDEYQMIVEKLVQAITRWSTGIYAIWYPIKQTKEINLFYKALIKTGIQKVLRCEIHLREKNEKLDACGMIIVNPPWQWQEKIKTILPTLCDVYAARAKCDFLTPA
jgi:23S rRNA (adenine2030-N6)-methyltransferase